MKLTEFLFFLELGIATYQVSHVCLVNYHMRNCFITTWCCEEPLVVLCNSYSEFLYIEENAAFLLASLFSFASLFSAF